MNLRETFILQLFLAILTFSADNYGCCVEAGQEPPAPVILQLQAFNANQTLVVRWLGQSPREQQEHYQLQFARPDLVNYSVSVRPLGGGGNHTFAWTSPLPLECADHSVRVRRFHDDSIFSSWSQWMTNIGGSPASTTQIFPNYGVLLEGTRPWLCCIPPPGATITRMEIVGVPYPLISIGDRVKAIEADKLQSPPGTFKMLRFSCTDSTSRVKATFIYPSIPPEKPRNLSCETLDMKSVTCRWDPGKEDHLVKNHKRIQTLNIIVPNLENSSVQHKCEKSSCKFPVVTGLEQYHVSLLVSNPLGEQSVRHSFNISDCLQVSTEVGHVSAGVTKANLSLIAEQFLLLHDLRCEITLNNESRATVPCGGDRLCGATVVGLLPNTNYSARVRCGLKGKTPGRWSQITSFSTLQLVTLDLWRRIKEFSNNSRSVTLMWTPPEPGLAGAAIERYRIRVSRAGSHHTTTAHGNLSQAHISVGPGQCEVTVQADVSNSVPASITIPRVDAGEPRAAEQRLSFRTHLSWAGEDSATCGYTVEWWCMLGKVSCALKWRKLPRENTSLLLNPRDYEDGVRYTFNVYGCTENGHKLLGIQTGYFVELKPVELLQQVEPVASTSSSVTLAWRYQEDDPAHPGFITGYLVTVQEADTQGSPSQTLFNVSVMDPREKSVTVRGLQEDTKYQFSLSAVTQGGSGPVVITTVNTSSDLLVSLVKILTPLALLLAFALLLCHQRNNLMSWQQVIFAFPDVTNIKAFELERFLQETSEKLDTQQLDECVCCDIEIINTK